MRRVILIACAILLLSGGAVRAADPPANVRGLWLLTDYPAVAARAGETATVRLKLQNANMTPEQVTLSVNGVPAGWKAEFRGGGQPVGAAMPGFNDSVSLELRLEIPADTAQATHTLTVRAQGASQRAELPLRVTLGGDLPTKLSVKPKLPSLRGTAKSSFEYNVTVANDSGKTLIVSLGSDVPAAFQTSFTEGYGSQEISSIPIEAGQNKEIKMKVQPPSTLAAGNYDLRMRVVADGVTADTPLRMEVTGQPKLRIAGKDGRLSGQAEAGSEASFELVLTNDGSAPAEEVELSASPPAEWKIEFEPKQIARLEPNQSRPVQALITPAKKAIAGDYMTTLRANAKGDSNTADFRISVATSTIWGVVGLGVIAIALLVLVGAVARFGRR